MFSSDIELFERTNGITRIGVKYLDSFNLKELLAMLNSVDLDSLKYRPVDLRNANKCKQVLVKQLEEQWRNKPEVVDFLVHPDSSYIVENITIDNSVLRDNGASCKLYDGDYRLLYFSNSSTLDNFIRVTKGGMEAVTETSILPMSGVVARSTDCICMWGNNIKGLAFLIKVSSPLVRIIPQIEDSLKTGNLMIAECAGKFNLVFLNRL